MANPLDASWSFKDRRREDSTALGTALGDKIWGLGNTTDSRFYLEHYNAHCAGPDATNLSFATHKDVIELVDLVKNGRNRTFQDLRADIGGKPRAWLPTTSDATIRSAVRFAISLWLMVDISSWEDNVSLCGFVPTLFPLPTPSANPVEGELSLNARSLFAIGGFDLVYTSQLNEHLRLNKAISEVYLFRHASFLGGRVDTGQEYVNPPTVPRLLANTYGK
jgi:hypothetical protein